MIYGIDYAWGRPSVDSMKSAGVKFVMRYLSSDTSGKNLTRAEADYLSKAGIWIGVVWETTANRALSGRAGGTYDAQRAHSQAVACGMPPDRPIYFAVDWDATAAQQDTIHAYLDGAASVIGRDRVGLYAGYYPIKRAFDARKITYGWQTYAWSGGKWDSRAQLQQYENGIRTGGVDSDRDKATTDDYGQWMIGRTPDMALTDSDIQKIVKALVPATWNTDAAPAPAGVDATKNPNWAYVNVMRETYTRTLEIKGMLSALVASPTSPVDTAAVVAGVLAGLAPETLAEAIAEHLGSDVAGQVLDSLRNRLES